MKRLAICIVAAVIFQVAMAYAEPNNTNTELESKVSTQANETPRQTISDEPHEPKTAEVASTPIQEPKVAETAPKTPEIVCGPADPTNVYNILREIGVPRSSAIQILGSWKSESHLDPCQKIGDGGLAWGLNSWHPGRRHDMPQELRAQINWAIHTEMKRDCASCYATIMQGGDTYTIRSAIKQSTRWGVEGARWTYADQFASLY